MGGKVPISIASLQELKDAVKQCIFNIAGQRDMISQIEAGTIVDDEVILVCASSVDAATLKLKNQKILDGVMARAAYRNEEATAKTAYKLRSGRSATDEGFTKWWNAEQERLALGLPKASTTAPPLVPSEKPPTEAKATKAEKPPTEAKATKATKAPAEAKPPKAKATKKPPLRPRAVDHGPTGTGTVLGVVATDRKPGGTNVRTVQAIDMFGDGTALRECPCCKITKPYSEFGFRVLRFRVADAAPGQPAHRFVKRVQPWCRECRKTARKVKPAPRPAPADSGAITAPLAGGKSKNAKAKNKATPATTPTPAATTT
jgi:hypothetical protein